MVLSARADDILATQTVVDVIGRLQTTFWIEHQVLIRGGIAKGELVHVQGGQLFGPAMNCAYRLESKEADGPRVLIHGDCLAHLAQQPTWHLLAPFFAMDSDGKVGMSLAECYAQLLVYSAFYVSNEPGWQSLHASLLKAPEDLAEVQARHDLPRVIAKYEWLRPKIEAARTRLKDHKFLAAPPAG